MFFARPYPAGTRSGRSTHLCQTRRAGLMKFVEALDSAIGFFSPHHELKRHFAREQLTRSRNAQYAAAKTTRLTGAWSPINSNVNAIIGASSSTVRARVRQLVRDFPYFARAINILTDYVVGPGIMFQSRVQDEEGRHNKRLIQQIEDAFNFWADEADVARKLHFYEMMRLAKRQDVESGEFLLVKTTPRRASYIPFALQIYEADWLTALGDQPANPVNKIEQGIEYDMRTGEVIAYHLTAPDFFYLTDLKNWGQTKRIPAELVIHNFETLRPGQLRGISPCTPAVLVANDLNSYMDAEIDAAKMAAKYLAFIKTPDPYSRQMATVETDSATNKKVEEMENAILEYLRPGEDVQLASNPRPGGNFPPFVKLLLCMVSVLTGGPYELLSGAYTDMNFSTSKTVRKDFSQQLRPITIRHIRHFAYPIFRAFMEAAVLSGKLDLPGVFSNPYPYLRCDWQQPRLERREALRDTKSDIEEINRGLRSPQEIVKSRGRDLEEVYKEIAAAKEIAEE